MQKQHKKLALGGKAKMYKFDRYHQYSLSDFNQPLEMEMNPENRWVKKAAMIPWDEIEDRYAGLFPSKVGMPAKPLQTALGSLLIQKKSTAIQTVNWLSRSKKTRTISTSLDLTKEVLHVWKNCHLMHITKKMF